MKNTLLILSGLLYSSFSFGNPLIGKWATKCQNYAAERSFQAFFEFKEDGKYEAGGIEYRDEVCKDIRATHITYETYKLHEKSEDKNYYPIDLEQDGRLSYDIIQVVTEEDKSKFYFGLPSDDADKTTAEKRPTVINENWVFFKVDSED